MRKHISWILLFVLTASFFGFVDDRFRGWSDTHQYQISAKAWKAGKKPPVKELLLDTESPEFVGPTHVAPLTPYLWSFLVNPSDSRKTIKAISILQALLLSYCFIVFVLLLGGGRPSMSSLAIGTLLFFHPYVRWWIFMPMSEPLSLTLLLTSYIATPAVGFLAGLQACVRPPVGLLHIPILIRNKKSLSTIVGFGVAILVSFAIFHDLLIPSSFRGMGWSLDKSLSTLRQFVFETSLIFKRLFDFETAGFQFLWGLFLTTLLLAIIVKNRKNWLVLFCSLIYLLTVLLASGEAYRYFFPALLILFIEFKPLPKSKWVQILILGIALHNVFQHIEAMKELKGDRYPQTDSPGLQAAQKWLKENSAPDDVIMMYRYRFCVNYFERGCISLPRNPSELDLSDGKFQFIVINRLYWQTEVLAFEKYLTENAKRLALPSPKIFDNVAIYDLRSR